MVHQGAELRRVEAHGGVRPLGQFLHRPQKGLPGGPLGQGPGGGQGFEVALQEGVHEGGGSSGDPSYIGLHTGKLCFRGFFYSLQIKNLKNAYPNPDGAPR